MKCPRSYLIVGGGTILILLAIAYVQWFLPVCYEHVLDCPHETGVPPTQIDNAYMTMTVPSGWTIKEANGNGSTTLQKTLQNRKFLVYVNPQAMQSSLVEGGIFADIAKNIPSIQAVMKGQPTNTCGTVNEHLIVEKHEHHGLWIDASETDTGCVIPTTGKKVWYFDYIAPHDSFVNYYRTKSGETKSWSMVMGYDDSRIEHLPYAEGPLAELLTQMDAEFEQMAISLIIKDSVGDAAVQWKFLEKSVERTSPSGLTETFPLEAPNGHIPSEYNVLADPLGSMVFFEETMRGRIWSYSTETHELLPMTGRFTSPNYLVSHDKRFILMPGETDAFGEVRNLQAIDLIANTVITFAQLPPALSYAYDISDHDASGMISLTLQQTNPETYLVAVFLAAEPMSGIFGQHQRSPVAQGEFRLGADIGFPKNALGQ